MPFFKPHTYTLPRSRVLENTTKKNGLRHTIYNTVGDRYVGEWRDDKKHGKGVILTRKKELYEGDIENNQRHGFGILAEEVPNTGVFRLIYRGDWKRGKMDGHGLRIYPDGSFYIGNFKKGKRHGHGQQWWPDGAFYDGEYKEDLKEGLGVFIRGDGNRYEGHWKNDLKNGSGLFLHLDSGQGQEGVWRDDLCVYSQMKDIDYRQCCEAPTPFPIPNVTLKNVSRVCAFARERALSGMQNLCLDDVITYADMHSNWQEEKSD